MPIRGLKREDYTMIEIQSNLDAIHQRFVKGILKGMNPDQLHDFVTRSDDAERKAS